MAGLLRIQPQIPGGSPGVNVPQNAWQTSGNSLSEFGEFLQKQEDAADTLAATRAAGEASAGMDGAIKIANTKTNDPTEFSLLAQEESDKAHNAVRDRLRPGARARYDAIIADNLGKAKTAIALGAHGKMVENARGDIDISEQQYQAGIRASTDPSEQAALIKGYRTMIEFAEKQNILSPKEASDKIQAFETKSSEGIALMHLERDPSGFLKQLQVGGYSHIEVEKRLQFQARAKAILNGEREAANQARIEAERVKKQRIDDLNTGILVASTSPGANLIALRDEILRNSSALDFKSTEHWVDRLDKAIKAQQAGEDSPFFKSQGDILGHVMKGIIEEPEKWSVTDVTQYIGKGLSAAHGKELATTLETRKKEGGVGKMTPLGQARDSWELQHRNGGFLNADEQAKFKKKDPAMIAENDRRAQAVLDKVIAADRMKQDPRNALRVEMQPYHNQTVTSWGDRLLPGSGGFLSGTRPKTPEEIAAAQFAASRGQNPNDPKVIEAAKKALSGASMSSEKAALERAKVLEKRVQQLQNELIEKGFPVTEY